MVAKFDGLLFRYAGWLIKIAAFFGISRWQLIVLWSVSSGLINMIPATSDHKFATLLAIGFAIATMGLIGWAKMAYREDELMANDLMLRSARHRTNLFLLLCVATLVSGVGHWPLMIARPILNMAMIVWFCLHQPPKDPVTLRKWIGSLAARIRTALTPTPQPKLAPQPVMLSAPPS